MVQRYIQNIHKCVCMSNYVCMFVCMPEGKERDNNMVQTENKRDKITVEEVTHTHTHTHGRAHTRVPAGLTGLHCLCRL